MLQIHDFSEIKNILSNYLLLVAVILIMARHVCSKYSTKQNCQAYSNWYNVTKFAKSTNFTIQACSKPHNGIFSRLPC